MADIREDEDQIPGLDPFRSTKDVVVEASPPGDAGQAIGSPHLPIARQRRARVVQKASAESDAPKRIVYVLNPEIELRHLVRKRQRSRRRDTSIPESSAPLWINCAAPPLEILPAKQGDRL